jgi:hypothetical protein
MVATVLKPMDILRARLTIAGAKEDRPPGRMTAEAVDPLGPVVDAVSVRIEANPLKRLECPPLDDDTRREIEAAAQGQPVTLTRVEPVDAALESGRAVLRELISGLGEALTGRRAVDAQPGRVHGEVVLGIESGSVDGGLVDGQATGADSSAGSAGGGAHPERSAVPDDAADPDRG